MPPSSEAPHRVRPPARALGAILALGLLLRLLYLAQVASRPGFVWDDPDSYMSHGLEMASGTGGWHFDFAAVEHRVEGGRYVLPPLYPVFLSFFALFPGYPVTAQVGQAALATLGIYFVFLLGRRIHGDRAGLVAALLMAVWFPNVIAVWSTMQEALYVPLVLLGFVLLLSARSAPGFVVSGLAFGLAALTRSMPLYYLPIAGLLLLVARGPKRGGLLAGALAVGFCVLTVPYSIALSRHLGTATFIENHAGLKVAAEEGGLDSGRPPGALSTGLALMRGFAIAPSRTISEWMETLRSILHVNGGRLLQIYLGARTKLGSIAWKVAAHVFGDLTFIATLLLAPFGLAWCRDQERGLFLGAWVLVNLTLTVLSGFGGPRLRAPVEPQLMVLAAVAVTGTRRRANPVALAAAAIVATGFGYLVVPQLSRSFAARGDYGVDWPLDPPPKRAPMVGEAGFNVLAVDGYVELALRPRNENESGNTDVTVSLEGEPAEKITIGADEIEHWFRLPWAVVDLVYAEIEARDATTGRPVRLLVVVPAR
jgi:4-amino-4-deoxy-L-arabinose transferase-like glycosyltransferase